MLNKKLMILMAVVALGVQQAAFAAFDASGYGKDVAKAQTAKDRFEMVADPKAQTPQDVINDKKEEWVKACISLGGNKFWDRGKDVISDVNRLAAYDLCGGFAEVQKERPKSYAIWKDADNRRAEINVRADAKKQADLDAAAAAARRVFGGG